MNGATRMAIKFYVSVARSLFDAFEAKRSSKRHLRDNYVPKKLLMDGCLFFFCCSTTFL